MYLESWDSFDLCKFWGPSPKLQAMTMIPGK